MLESANAISIKSYVERQPSSPALDDVPANSKTVASLNTPPALSPRITTDPIVGKVVMEFRNGETGEITLQVPSEAALAYLRAGLTATGAPVDKKDDKSGSGLALKIGDTRTGAYLV